MIIAITLSAFVVVGVVAAVGIAATAVTFNFITPVAIVVNADRTFCVAVWERAIGCKCSCPSFHYEDHGRTCVCDCMQGVGTVHTLCCGEPLFTGKR